MNALNAADLRKAIANAIFDPGQTEGMKGDRDLTTWQTDAVIRVIDKLVYPIAENTNKPSPGNEAITGEAARGEACDLSTPSSSTDVTAKVIAAAELYLSRQPVYERDTHGEPLYAAGQMLRAFCAGEIAVIDRVDVIHDDIEKCPICAEPLKPSDICATDIEMGICHAACLEGSPVVDLDTGEEIEGGKVDTFLYGEDRSAATPPPSSHVMAFNRAISQRDGSTASTPCLCQVHQVAKDHRRALEEPAPQDDSHQHHSTRSVLPAFSMWMSRVQTFCRAWCTPSHSVSGCTNEHSAISANKFGLPMMGTFYALFRTVSKTMRSFSHRRSPAPSQGEVGP